MRLQRPTRCVIVGAGMIGVCTAVRLAENGAAVTLVDAGSPGGGTSGTTFAHVNASWADYDSYFDVRAMGLAATRRLASQWPCSDPWFISTGRLHFEETAEGHLAAAAHAATLRERGYSVLEVIQAVKRISGRDFEVRLADRRPGDPAAIVAASDKIRAALGWTPAFDDLDAVVGQALRWEEQIARREQAS